MILRKSLRNLFGNGKTRSHQKEISIPQINFYSGLGDGSWLLYGLVRSLQPKVAVEIGAARGMSACYIGMALKSLGAGKLYSIDPHTNTNWNDDKSIDTFEIMSSNLKVFEVQNYVEVIREYSHKTAVDWQLPIDFLFIDGDHSYEGVKRDWELFFDHLTPFGVVVFHDTLWDLETESVWSRSDMGVPRFVEELRQRGYPVITIPKNCGLSIVQPTLRGISLRK